MRFFTPDLLARFGSDDDQLAQAAREELEHRTEAYIRTLHEIEPILPPRFRELLDRFYLHDARVVIRSPAMGTDLEQVERSLRLGMPPEWEALEGQEHRIPSYRLQLQLDAPPGEILVLQYRSVQIEKAVLHETLFEECPDLEWQYDEVDIVRAGEDSEFRHSILFTRGLELQLRFKGFDFATSDSMETAEELVRLGSPRPPT